MLDDRFAKSENVCQQKSGVSDSAKFFQKKIVFIQTQNIVAESQLEKCGLKYVIHICLNGLYVLKLYFFLSPAPIFKLTKLRIGS